MTDITKLPKWARDILAERDRNIARLEESVATLRGERVISDPVGELLQNGYREETLPIGKFFRLKIGDLEVHMRDGHLVVSAEGGYPAVVPVVSNVIALRHIPYER